MKQQEQEFKRIYDWILESDMPHKQRKMDGLRTCVRRGIRLQLLDGTLLTDGIAIDPSELENGYWL